MLRHVCVRRSSRAPLDSCVRACLGNGHQQPARSLFTRSDGKLGKRSKWRMVLYGVGAAGSLVVLGVAWKGKQRRDHLRNLEKNWDELAPRRKRLVVLGSGWGAMSLLRQLDPGLYDIHVVSPRNYFLFTPLLPSVTVGTVEARSVAAPIRKLLQRSHGNLAHYYEAECVSIDVRNRVSV